MPLHLRPAATPDIPSIARVGAAAFTPETDPIIRNLFPERLRPAAGGEDPQIAWRVYRKTAKLDDRGCALMVIVEREGEEEDQEEVVGFAQWEIPGDHGPPPPPPDPASMSGLVSAEALAATRAAVDPEAMAMIPAAVEGAAREVFGERGYKDAWYLNFLAVDPRHQRRGIGKMLLQWGVDRAAAEGKDCFLIASPAGRPLYQASGFEQVGATDFWGVPHASMIIKNDARWRLN